MDDMMLKALNEKKGDEFEKFAESKLKLEDQIKALNEKKGDEFEKFAERILHI